MLTVVLIVAAIAVVGMVVIGMMDEHVMPGSCPRCSYGGDSDLVGTHRVWFDNYRGGGTRAHCRSCGTWFRESADGSLVEDRSS